MLYIIYISKKKSKKMVKQFSSQTDLSNKQVSILFHTALPVMQAAGA